MEYNMFELLSDDDLLSMYEFYLIGNYNGNLYNTPDEDFAPIKEELERRLEYYHMYKGLEK